MTRGSVTRVHSREILERTPHLHADHAAPVLRRAANVGERVDRPGIALGDLACQRRVELLAVAERADLGEPLRPGCDSADDHAERAAAASGSDADARAVLVRAAAELPVRRPLLARDANADDQLVGLQRGLVVARDQLLERDLALTVPAPDERARLERGQHRRRVGGVVGVCEHSAHGRLVPDTRARHERERAGEARPALPHCGRELDRPMRLHGSEAQLAVRLDSSQLGDRAQAEKPLRRQESLVQENGEERSAGHDRRLVPVLGLQRERLRERVGSEPLGRGLRHRRAPPRRTGARARGPRSIRIRSKLQRCFSRAHSSSQRPSRTHFWATSWFVSSQEIESAACRTSASCHPPNSWSRTRALTSATSGASAPSPLSQSPTIWAERSEWARLYASSPAVASSCRAAGHPGNAAPCHV